MALVVVQRGHVPRTTGAVGAPGEQQFARATADRVAAYVRGLGHRVRIIDADPPASSYRGDLFVSLHYDSSANPSARGASVGYQTADGRRFATAWKRYYGQAGWTGGFRPDNYTANLAQYYGVRTAVQQGNRIAFISEAGFHSNPQDAALLRAPDGPERVAWAIAAAVAELKGGTMLTKADLDQAARHTVRWVSHGNKEETQKYSLRTVLNSIAANRALLQQLMAQNTDLTTDQISTAVATGVAAGLPDARELAQAVVEAVDQDLDRSVVETALRSALGSVSPTGDDDGGLDHA